VRNQQVCWVEIDGKQTQLVSARVELPGATKMERFVARGRNPHSDIPVCVASWPAGPDWPAPDKKAARTKPALADPQAPAVQPASRTRRPTSPDEPSNPNC
jgi:hypothetical protein